MKHVEHARRISPGIQRNEKTLFKRASGKFYTPVWMAELLAERLLGNSMPRVNPVRVVDPFCGDGRLLVAVAERIAKCPSLRAAYFHFELWDMDQYSTTEAKRALSNVIRSAKLKAKVHARRWDTFLDSAAWFARFHLVATNPPWEVLKPDNRELLGLSSTNRRKFMDGMRAYDKALAVHLPYSQPSEKLYGWGTNLSRCGLEIAVKLLTPDGLCGIVLPSSILADQVSGTLRRWLLQQADILSVDYFPAEVKPFDLVDQSSVAVILKRQESPGPFQPLVTRHGRNPELTASEQLKLTAHELEALGVCREYGITILTLSFELH